MNTETVMRVAHMNEADRLAFKALLEFQALCRRALGIGIIGLKENVWTICREDNTPRMDILAGLLRDFFSEQVIAWMLHVWGVKCLECCVVADTDNLLDDPAFVKKYEHAKQTFLARLG